MTKKEFKESVNSQTYTGYNGKKIRINAFYFDWKSGELNGKYFAGYKYMVSTNVLNYKKAELLDFFYQWVTGEIAQPDYYIDYKYAETDDKRFKVPLSL